MIIFQDEMPNLAKSIHLKKIHSYSKRVNTNVIYGGNCNLFLNMLQKKSFKKYFL
jgi:hypothetical protein